MNLRKMPFKKSAKFLTLLLTSVLIASVSAGMYLSLTMTSTITVYESSVYFVKGTDANVTGGPTLYLDSTNTTATITGLRAYPNATFTYENVTLVRNNGTSPSNIRLAPEVDPSTNPEDFVYVKFLLNATVEADRRWLNYTSNGSSWTNTGTTQWVQIGSETQWPIVIITMATSAGNAGDWVTISIAVDVD